ncbi:hypothetical protein ALI144C_08315 [Actinosynnema sp. ALI-1.44]|nr:hypothetical protein ALI144C_08315 [Actinosynnema sp. ALI-1.44]
MSYQAGKVQPPDTVLRVAVGQPVKINIRSDRSDDITVDEYPDSNADVDPTEPEDIDFTPTRPGTVTVRLRAAAVTLATVHVS